MNSFLTHLPLGFLGNFQGWEWIVVLVVILLLFGGKKLPELARGAGKAIREFKKISSETEQTFRKAMDEEDEDAAEKKQQQQQRPQQKSQPAERPSERPAEPKAIPPLVSPMIDMPETPDAAVPPIMPGQAASEEDRRERDNG